MCILSSWVMEWPIRVVGAVTYALEMTNPLLTSHIMINYGSNVDWANVYSDH